MSLDITDVAWVFTSLSMLGAFLNARGDKRCFYVWLVANFFWLWIDSKRGINAQAFLYAYFIAMNIYGIYAWKEKKI